jgi:acetoin utilization deacetylase AcuC-like enzyme
VLFISIHQWPLYPGSGWIDEVGSGEGRGLTVNLPMPPGSGDHEYTEAFDSVVEPIIGEFDPGLLIVSAGQDGHIDDPLSDQALTVAGYEALASRSARLANRLGVGLVALHEGGYNIDTLPALDHAILAGLGGFETLPFEPLVPGHSAAGEGNAADWTARMDQVVEAQVPFWGPALRA